MIYLFESELPKKKSVFFALTRIYGIGKTHSVLICKKLGFSLNLKIEDLTKDQSLQLTKVIESLNLTLSVDLKKIKLQTLKNLVSIKSYRGLRRRLGLPVRGQRTHTNAKTSRKIR